MKRNGLSWVAGMALTMAFALGCPSGGDSGESGESESESAGDAGGADVANGKQLFATVCATCHGASGEGVQGLGKSLQDSEWLRTHSDEQFAKLILEGRTADHPDNTTKIAMPPKGGNPSLSEEDVHDIVAYVRTIQK